MELPDEQPLPQLSAARLPLTARAHPNMRASAQDRDDYIEVVKQAFADGQLDTTELEDRVDQAILSKTLDDLQPVLDGLNLDRLTTGGVVAIPAVSAVPGTKSKQSARSPKPEKTLAIPKTRQPLTLKQKIAIAAAAAALTGAVGVGVVTDAQTGLFSGRAWGQSAWGDEYAQGTFREIQTGLNVGTSQADIPATMEHSVGNLELDYSGLQLTQNSEHDIILNGGTLTLIVPRDANVIVNYDVTAANHVEIASGTGWDVDADHSNTDQWYGLGNTITFNITVNGGDLTVRGS
jgi:hypothetical protein